MDRKNNFLNDIVAFLNSIDEEYIIGISNKGIFNRAIKDLNETGSISYTLKENSITCSLKDGNTCLITEDIKNYKCSCPSRTVCKHVVMSYIYLKENMDSIFPKEINKEMNLSTEVTPLDFEWLKDISLKEIKKLLGEKSFQDIIKRIKFGVKIFIEEAVFINVNFMQEDILVKFTTGFMEKSICSCKTKDFCTHKAEAIIHYKLLKGFITKEELYGFDSSVIKIDRKVYEVALYEVRKLIEDILITGLSRLHSNIEDRLEQTAVICHNFELPNFEKQLREIEEEIKLYFSKNATFSKQTLKNKLTWIYNCSFAILDLKDNQKLDLIIGEYKTSYYEIPPIEIYGVGAGSFKTKSGFEGITHYFLNITRNSWFTYTTTMPTYYEGIRSSVKDMYKGNAPWGLNCKAEELSRCHLRLVNAKINLEQRLSVSQQCKGSVLNAVNIFDLNIDSFVFEDWEQLLNRISEENYKLVFLKIKRYGISDFDKINQIFTLPLFDINQRKLLIKLEFSIEGKALIERLEGIEKRNKVNLFLGKVYLQKGRLNFIPITAYYKDGSISNLTLD